MPLNKALSEAAESSHHPKVVELLLQYNADPTYEDCLLSPCRHGEFGIAELLLKYKANIETLLDHYLEDPDQYCRTDIVDFLIKHKADIHRRDNAGNTMLHIACRYATSCDCERCGLDNYIPIVEALITHKADINAKNDNGNIPLYLGCRRAFKPGDPDPDVMHRPLKFLVSQVTDINAQNNYGRTLLHAASGKFGDNVSANEKSPRIVRLLLAYGANPSIKDLYGNTPFDYAVSDEISSILASACKQILPDSERQDILDREMNLSQRNSLFNRLQQREGAQMVSKSSLGNSGSLLHMVGKKHKRDDDSDDDDNDEQLPASKRHRVDTFTMPEMDTGEDTASGKNEKTQNGESS